uniref:40S ribosomal protein S27 n=1 Tax=Sphaeramia orbicularis TaxID=375764 RepID=A0A672YPT8_9TELE
MPLAKDLLHPSVEEEKRRHKKKRLVQSPNSYFMDVKCPGCYKITTVFSHAQTVVLCVGCSTVLCQPTGGKARLTEGIEHSPPAVVYFHPTVQHHTSVKTSLQASVSYILYMFQNLQFLKKIFLEMNGIRDKECAKSYLCTLVR